LANGEGSSARLPRWLWRVLCPALLVVLALWYVELSWQAGLATGLRPLSQLAAPAPGARVLVIAPHEDDEALGCAGLMSRAVASGAEVYVCLLTNGEGEELGAAWASKSLQLTPEKFVRLGLVRQRETRRVLARLGVPEDHQFFLGYPTGGLDRMWLADNWDLQHPFRSRFLRTDHCPYSDSFTPEAPYAGAQLLSDLSAVLRHVQPTMVFTVHPADVHRDHWPAYDFAALALAELALDRRERWARSVPLYSYLVHFPKWPVPWGYELNDPLQPPAVLARQSVSRWLSLPLSLDEARSKAKLIGTYRSQLGPYDRLLHAFARRNELFAVTRPFHLAPGAAVESPPDWSMEPVATTRRLRKHSGGDLLAVEVESRGEFVHFRARTLGPLRGSVTLALTLHILQPGPGAPRVVQATARADGSVEMRLADDAERLAPGREASLRPTGGDGLLELRVPVNRLQEWGWVMVDATTEVGGAPLDHATTRIVEAGSGPAG
jgi:LmbE family N-acetylglucosaminyl deacetylase